TRLARMHGADADHLVGDFVALVVADGQHHRILPRAALGRMADPAFDVERGDGLRRLRVGGIEAQVMPARRTDARAFEDRRLAVRAGARRTCRARPGVAHEASSRSALSALPLDFGASLSPQPHSTWPRMREPAVTVSEPALRSPSSVPVSSSSTREADSMLPSSSPATTTFFARTPPLSLAPFSMVRSPCTLTSPLNLPAMRTWPAPSILPSMVRSAAISDSLAGASAAARGGAAWVGVKSAAAGASRIGVGFCSAFELGAA